MAALKNNCVSSAHEKIRVHRSKAKEFLAFIANVNENKERIKSELREVTSEELQALRCKAYKYLIQ